MTDMTSGIGDLLQRLRTDGVEAGEAEKQRIVREAEAKADAVLADAERRAKEIIAAAEAQAEARRKQLDTELNMAARDFTLRFAERVKRQKLEPLVTAKVADALGSADVLKEILVELIRSKVGSATVTLSPETRSKLEGYFQNELARLLEGEPLEIINENGLGGFRLQRHGESFTWDVTGEAVANELSLLVAPALRKYLQLDPAQS